MDFRDLLGARVSRRGLGALAAEGLATLGLAAGDRGEEATEAHAAARAGGWGAGNHGISRCRSRAPRGTSAGGVPAFIPVRHRVGIEGEWQREFRSPRGIAVNSRSNVYVIDNGNKRIQKFTSSGVFLTAWGSTGVSDGQFADPLFLAIDAADFVYVADSKLARVQKFTSDGKFVLKWGAPGNRDGQFNSPTGIAVDRAAGIASVYVVDRESENVQRFTTDGAILNKWGCGREGAGAIPAPPRPGRRSRRRRRGRGCGTESHPVAFPHWGSLEPVLDQRQRKRQFRRTYGVAVDTGGNRYVTDYEGHSVRVFSRSGALGGQFGSNKNDNFGLDNRQRHRPRPRRQRLRGE